MRPATAFPHDALKGFDRNTKATWYAYSFHLGEFPQIRAFPPNNHAFCLVNVLKTKHIGTHLFPSSGKSFFDTVDDILRAQTFYRSIVLDFPGTAPMKR